MLSSSDPTLVPPHDVDFDESHPRHYSITPHDVGFDLRVLRIAYEMPADVEAIRFDVGGQPRVATGTREEIARALRSAGYEVRS